MADGKETPRDAPPDLQIKGDQITLQPSGFVEPPVNIADETKEEQLMKHMARFRSEPLQFLREVSLYVSGTGWRAYDNVIGQPIFYPGFTENMKTKVLSAPLLQARIAKLVDTRLAVEEREGWLTPADPDYAAKRDRRRAALTAQVQQVAEKLTDGMICKFESKTFIRGAYYLVSQLLLRAYHQGIHVSSEEILRLRKVAERAQRDKQSIIFLPCHRSHVDYLSLQLLCYRLGLALPVVVAGDNLNFPLVGSFLQHAGAFYIRRQFGDDVLYNALVQTYIDTLLQSGHNLECFIEGGRSRTGKLLPPKFGILSFILDSIMSGRVADAIICPVSTQYDKVIETEGYVTELLGVPKKKENLADFLTGGSSVLSLRLGRVDVRFHEPWSLRAFLDDQIARLSQVSPSPSTRSSSSSSSSGGGGGGGGNSSDTGSGGGRRDDGPAAVDWRDKWDPVVRQKLLRTLGYKVLADINKVSVVMPTALIGTVLLTLRGRGVGRAELIRRVEWLTERVRAKGGRVAHFGSAPLPDVVERGLEVLGRDLVGEVHNLAEPTYYAVDRFQLSFYRNMTIHLFISEALVAVALYTRVKQGGGPAHQDISVDDLYRQVFFLSSLFRGEFIFSAEGLEANFHKTLAGLEADGVIRVERDPQTGRPTKIGLSDAERAAGRENYDFYCFLIWPFVEASWLAAVSLMGLTPPPGMSHDIWIPVAKAQSTAQLLGKTLYHQGDLSYFEAVNKETLKNSYQRFEEEGILQVVKSKDAKIPPRLRLAPEWTPRRDASVEGAPLVASGRLWDFIERIAASRREGKNRRDGATVSTRVVRLADSLGRRLFEEAVEGDAARGKGKGKGNGPPATLSAEEARALKKEIKEERRRRRLSSHL